MSEIEEWRSVKDFPGYSVSNQGRVASYLNNRYGIGDTPHILRPWMSKRGGYPTVSLRRDGIKINRYVHHLVVKAFVEGTGPKTDHINGIRTDNRAENLRFASNVENACNRVGNLKSSSRFKGVAIDRNRGGWQAHIRDGKSVSLGRFDNEEAAARAYDAAAARIHGEFARLNFPVQP